jgi:hypothetical protein
MLSVNLLCAADETNWGSEPKSLVSESTSSPTDAKVPTFRPTQTVQSVLGLKPGQHSSPVGTSIQLLPPQTVEPPAPQVTQEIVLTPATDALPSMPSLRKSPANFVTRDNAQLHSMQLTWQTESPTVPTINRELVLRSVQPGLDPNSAPERSLSIPHAMLSPPQQLAGQATQPSAVGPNATPDGLPNFIANGNSIPVANRQNYPAWLRPSNADSNSTTSEYPNGPTVSQDAWQPRGQSRPQQPLRDPAPVFTPPQSVAQAIEPALTSPQLTVPNLPSRQPVGSGVTKPTTPMTELSTLAPVQRTPNRDRSPSLATDRADLSEIMDDVVEAETLPTLELLPDDADSMPLEAKPLAKQTKIVKPQTTAQNRAAKSNVPEGNNEGDSGTPLASEDIDGKPTGDVENDSIMQRLLEKDIVANQPAAPTEDVGTQPESRPGLSPMELKPLSIAPTGPLQPLDRGAELRDVRDDRVTAKGPQAKSIESLDRLSTSRLSQLDATGRLKTHSGITAVPNLDPAIMRMQQPIMQTLRTFHARTEQADKRSHWGMMHSIMVYGADTRIIARRRNYSAIAWMAGNNVCRGSRLMTTERGQIKVREGTGLQGHQSQWLAILSLAGVPATYPLYVDGQQFAVEDLVQVEAAACEEGKELTFTLIGLAHYLDTDATWTGVGGERWDFDRLIAAELNEPIVGAACGGTHRLMGFAHALRKRRLEGEPITGQWKRAEDFLNDFVQYTYTLQNRDGSFSTDWYESRQDNGELQRKVQVTGHMLEFLLTHIADEQVVDQQVVSAARFLVGAMDRVELDDAGVGYRGHALRSLAMFYRRAYGVTPEYPPGQMAFGQHNYHQKR